MQGSECVVRGCGVGELRSVRETSEEERVEVELACYDPSFCSDPTP